MSDKDPAEEAIARFKAYVENQAERGYPDLPIDDAHPGVNRAVRDALEDNPPNEADGALLYDILGAGTTPYKMGKGDADYKTEPQGDQACGNCEYYYEGAQGDSGVCSHVRGNDIQPEHWCRLWVPVE